MDGKDINIHDFVSQQEIEQVQQDKIVEEEILERSIKQRASQILSGSSLTKKIKNIDVGAKLDFETINSLEFTVSAFDGSTTSHGNFSLNVIDVDETTLLNEAEKDLITYFQHLVFWKGHANTPVERNQKWAVPLQLNLAGTISNNFSQVVNEVISEYNTIFNGNFTISLAETEELANAEVFYGTKEELESHWPDMHEHTSEG